MRANNVSSRRRIALLAAGAGAVVSRWNGRVSLLGPVFAGRRIGVTGRKSRRIGLKSGRRKPTDADRAEGEKNIPAFSELISAAGFARSVITRYEGVAQDNCRHGLRQRLTPVKTVTLARLLDATPLAALVVAPGTIWNSSGRRLFSDHSSCRMRAGVRQHGF